MILCSECSLKLSYIPGTIHRVHPRLFRKTLEENPGKKINVLSSEEIHQRKEGLHHTPRKHVFLHTPILLRYVNMWWTL